jgi:hypothetical protein
MHFHENEEEPWPRTEPLLVIAIRGPLNNVEQFHQMSKILKDSLKSERFSPAPFLVGVTRSRATLAAVA